MKVSFEKNDIVIRIPMNAKPLQPSKSGKTLQVATSNGFYKTDLTIDEKPVSVSLNVTVPNN